MTPRVGVPTATALPGRCVATAHGRRCAARAGFLDGDHAVYSTAVQAAASMSKAMLDRCVDTINVADATLVHRLCSH